MPMATKGKIASHVMMARTWVEGGLVISGVLFLFLVRSKRGSDLVVDEVGIDGRAGGGAGCCRDGDGGGGVHDVAGSPDTGNACSTGRIDGDPIVFVDAGAGSGADVVEKCVVGHRA